jgi:hypothetical protein
MSDKQTQEIKHTTATLAEKAIKLLEVLAVETAEEAKRATAMPDAVIRVFAPSTYIVLLS